MPRPVVAPLLFILASLAGCSIAIPSRDRPPAEQVEAAKATARTDATTVAAANPGSIPLFANYYTWYATEFGPHKKWAGWGSKKPGRLAPNGADPSRILPSGRHDLSSMAYPLAGPYDSNDREVVRWHIQLAQAAGIEAFMVDWWGPGTWQDPPNLTYEAFVEAVLPVAEEENFKVFLFDETPQFYNDLDEVMEWIATYLTRFARSPAYLHIDGKPAYAIYQFWEGRMTPGEATRLKEYVEERVGPVYWILDKMRARPRARDDERMELFVPEEWLALDWVDCFMGYGTFHNIRKFDYEDIAPLYLKLARQVHQAGHKILLPVHPGHDNSKLEEEPWVIPPKEGETLRGYLRAATEAGADFVVVTSFNEWPETTVVEPSSSWPDPYQYLRILADWGGREFQEPSPAPAGRGSPELSERTGR